MALRRHRFPFPLDSAIPPLTMTVMTTLNFQVIEDGQSRAVHIANFLEGKSFVS